MAVLVFGCNGGWVMVPEGWEREPLCKIAEVRTGIAKGKKNLKNPIPVPYLRVANVQDGHLDLSVIKTIEVEDHQIDRYRLHNGDVLMTEGGDFDKLGRGDVWKGQIDPCLHQNHVFCVRPDQRIILPYFLSSLSGSSYGKFYFLSCAKKSTNLASINSTQLKEFPVLIPPLPEQKKIARILSTWDKAIETVEKLIENSQAQKKALMQQLLTGKRRLPGFDGEWKFSGFTDLFKIANDKSKQIKKTDYQETGSCPIVDQGKEMIVAYTDSTEPYSHIPVIVFGDHTRIIKWIDFEFAPGADGTQVLKTTEQLDLKLGYFLLNHINLPNLGYSRHMRELKEKEFRYPVSMEEQQKIASLLTTADKEIETLQQKLDRLKQEKKALMQQLLTGKRRVKVDADG